MTVTSTVPYIAHVGNGVTTSFPYPFRIFAAADMYVKVGGIAKTLDVDYTVAGAGNPGGGAVTFLAPPAAVAVELERIIDIERTTDYTPGGALQEDVFDADLDRIVMVQQQLDRKLDRMVTVEMNGYPVEVEPVADAVVRRGSDGMISGTVEEAGNVAGYFVNQTPAASSIPASGADGKLNPGWFHNQPVRGSYRNLAVATSSVTAVTVTADEIVLHDVSGNAYRRAAVSLAAAITASGANGLDTGAEAVSTWYYIWIIAKLDGTIAALLSASDTSPTMPSGYTLKARVGAVRNDAGGNFLTFQQRGAWVYFAVPQLIKDGSFTTSAWTAADASAVIPPIAARGWVLMGVSGGNTLGVAGVGSGYYGQVHRPGVSSAYDAAAIAPCGLAVTARVHYAELSYLRQSDNVYYHTTVATSSLYARGYEV